MQTAITLAPLESVSISTNRDGATVVMLPLAVLIRAYCDYVAAQVSRAPARSEGELVQ